jgi:hypothetical protein
MISIHMWATPAEASAAWSFARQFIEVALAKAPLSLLTADDVFRGVASGRMKLWEIRTPAGPRGAFVTEIVSGGAGRGVNILALGGRDMKSWLGDFAAAVEKYRADVDAKCLIAVGRTGWRRALSKYGWVDGPATTIKVA